MLSPKNYGVASAVLSTTGCELIRIQGYLSGSTDKWLQIHDSATLPADTAVPKRSYLMQAGMAFSWAWDPGRLVLDNGCTIAISDTEATLTISATTGDLMGELEPTSNIPQDYSVAGDLSTGVDSLAVWNNPVLATSPNTLYRFDFVNNDGATRYLMLFAAEAPADGARPIAQWEVTNGSTLVLSFGDNGLSPMAVLASGALRRGCCFAQSSTTTTLTATSSAASYMRAYYK